VKKVSGLSLLWAQPSTKMPTINQVAKTMVIRSSVRVARGRSIAAGRSHRGCRRSGAWSRMPLWFFLDPCIP